MTSRFSSGTYVQAHNRRRWDDQLHTLLTKWVERAIRHPKTSVGVLALAYTVVCPAGYLLQYNRINSREPNFNADAIVEFTGAKGRFKFAAEDLKPGQALFVSGVGEDDTIQKLLKREAVQLAPGVSESQIIAGYRAQDTIGNAQELFEFLRSNSWVHSVLVVTGAGHEVRAHNEIERLKKEYNSDVEFSYAVPNPQSPMELVLNNKLEVLEVPWRNLHLGTGREHVDEDAALPPAISPVALSSPPKQIDLATIEPDDGPKLPNRLVTSTKPMPRHHRNIKAKADQPHDLSAKQKHHQAKVSSHKSIRPLTRSALSGHHRP